MEVVVYDWEHLDMEILSQDVIVLGYFPVCHPDFSC
uniref:Uncharacterized protein n=1 Tax=Arundo donax TaxID=35708 RepID=A0A0A8ZA14_ARUDO